MDLFPVTVAVLTFNRLPYTRLCFESILANTRPGTFLLDVHDNGSTDGTVAYLKGLRDAGHLHNLTLARTNMGLSAGKNALVRHATTKLVCLLDNDFQVEPRWLDRMVAVLKAESRIAAVSPYSAMPDHHPTSVVGRHQVGDETVIDMDRLGGTMLIDRKRFMNVNGFPIGGGRKIHFASTPFWKALRDRLPHCWTVTMDGLAVHLDEQEDTRAAVMGPANDAYMGWQKLQKRNVPVPPLAAWQDLAVDVVIPVYGALHLLERCLEGIRRFTSHPHTTILVSDRPADHEAVKVLADQYGCQAIYNEKNVGFPTACNRGWKAGRAPLVCLLNSDTIPGPLWLPLLVAHMAANPRAGIVGPSTSSCAGLQKVKLPGDRHGVTVDQLPALATSMWSTFGHKTQECNLSGFCFLTRRTILEALKGLDESYGLGYGEENDFELRSWAAGWRSVHVMGAYVHHYGKQSFGTLPAEVVQALKNRNLAKVDARRIEVRALGKDLAARVVDPRKVNRKARWGYPVLVKGPRP